MSNDVALVFLVIGILAILLGLGILTWRANDLR
jgi:hypothetical protein